MKKILFTCCLGCFLFSCNNEKKESTAAPETKPVTERAMDLPYKASYSSTWTNDVSDADLKTVLQSYKDWADGNMNGLSGAMADTVTIDMSSGEHLVKSNADLMKMWGKSRDSMSSVTIDMQGWHKMYEPTKKAGYIVTWYKEIDSYKTGKVDSNYYHDINEVKNGKISWYAQYKRPAK